jgi:transposase InsO family protein
MKLWRITRARYQQLDGEGARQHGGRWNSEGRPHRSLGRLTPAEYAKLHQQSEEKLATISSDLP